MTDYGFTCHGTIVYISISLAAEYVRTDTVDLYIIFLLDNFLANMLCWQRNKMCPTWWSDGESSLVS